MELNARQLESRSRKHGHSRSRQSTPVVVAGGGTYHLRGGRDDSSVVIKFHFILIHVIHIAQTNLFLKISTSTANTFQAGDPDQYVSLRRIQEQKRLARQKYNEHDMHIQPPNVQPQYQQPNVQPQYHQPNVQPQSARRHHRRSRTPVLEPRPPSQLEQQQPFNYIAFSQKLSGEYNQDDLKSRAISFV